jgi:hypothetical protein
MHATSRNSKLAAASLLARIARCNSIIYLKGKELSKQASIVTDGKKFIPAVK